ncbi:MAG: DUF4329 domain-containing protein [Paracoccaceae bacterium]
MRNCLLLIAFLLCLGSIGPAQAQNAEEMAAAKRILSGLQERSIKNNREYCGLLLRRSDGTLFSSKAFRGTKARCRVRRIPRNAKVVASYHTHGSYLPRFDNEVPSILDLRVEMEWGIDGYVTTPGGRFWHVDGRRGRVDLICGRKCVPSDPNYRDDSGRYGKIRTGYTLQALSERGSLRR